MAFARRIRTMKVQVGNGVWEESVTIGELGRLARTINRDGWDLVPAGHLLCEDFRYSRKDQRLFAHFALSDRPWDHAAFLDGRWRPVVDRSGRPPYSVADFGVIP
jgi:hypothetical protein